MMGNRAILTPQHAAAPPKTATDGRPSYLFKFMFEGRRFTQRARFPDLRLRIELYYSSATSRWCTLAHERKTYFCNWCCTERAHICQDVRCRFANLKGELTNSFNIEPPGRPTHLPLQTVRRYILAQQLLVWPTPTTLLVPLVLIWHLYRLLLRRRNNVRLVPPL
jgi:hypothetical protein